MRKRAQIERKAQEAAFGSKTSEDQKNIADAYKLKTLMD